MLKRLVFLTMLVSLALILFVSPARALAADTPHIGNLEISVWPEYDQPGVLVQY